MWYLLQTEKMKRIILLLLGFVTISCSHNSLTFYDCFKLQKSNLLNFEPTNDLSIFKCRIQHNKSDEFITFEKNDTIHVYDVGLEMLKNKIGLTELKNMTYRDHLYHNEDSLFICSISQDYEMLIILLDHEGKIANRWNISELTNIDIPGGSFYIDSRYFHPMILMGDQLYFNASYNFKAGSLLEKQVPTQMILNLSTGSAVQFGDLPSEYKRGKFYGNHQRNYSRIINNDEQLVFSFPISHDIYIYSIEGILLHTEKCKSRYISNFETIDETQSNGDISAIIDAYSYNARYLDLIFDKYNNRYFRIALHKFDKFRPDGTINDYRLRRWSVLILDENLNIMDEVLMPENIFMTRLIPTSNGIMLQPINTNNTNELQTYTFQACLN